MSIVNKLKNKPSFLSYVKATSEDIYFSEKELSLMFSEEYNQYLMEFGFATYEGHELTGICKSKRLNVVDVTKANRELFNDIPDDWYVIEEAHIDGIVIWQSTVGKIYQTMPGREPIMIAESLAEYISM